MINFKQMTNNSKEIAIITDKLGTTYMGIHNFYNSFCYYISAIQRLHSSLTLREALKKDIFNEENRSDSKDTHKISQNIFQLLIDYNNLGEMIQNECANTTSVGDSVRHLQFKPNLRGAALKKYLIKQARETAKEFKSSEYVSDNISKVYRNMRKYEKVIDELIDDNLKHGGDPQAILLYLFFPIIYHYTDDDSFTKILKELNFNILHFSNTNYDENSFKIIKNNKEHYNEKLREWYGDILKYKSTLSEKLNENSFENQFCVTTLCIFFASVYKRDYSANCGHAITLILAEDDNLYVIDDSKNILLFKDYVKFSRSKIYEMELKDLTKEVIQKLTNYKEFNVDQRIYRTVLKMNNNLTAGFKNSGVVLDEPLDITPKFTFIEIFKRLQVTYKIPFQLYYGVLFILIIVIIIYSIKLHQNKMEIIILKQKNKHLSENINKLKIKLEERKNDELKDESINSASEKLIDKVINKNTSEKYVQLNKYIRVKKSSPNYNISIADSKNFTTKPSNYFI